MRVADSFQVLHFDQKILDALGLAPDAVRANVLVDDAINDLPSGTLLRLGSSLALRLTVPCEPRSLKARAAAALPSHLLRRTSARAGTIATESLIVEVVLHEPRMMVAVSIPGVSP